MRHIPTHRLLDFGSILMVILAPILSVAEEPATTTAKSPYTLPVSVLCVAGFSGTSPTFTLHGTVGQPTPGSGGSDGSHDLGSGIWQTILHTDWLSPVFAPELLENRLYPNFPNPFNPLTTIQYTVAAPENVVVSIFNLRGERVHTLVQRQQPSGRYTVIWDGRDGCGRSVSSGLYFCRLTIGKYASTRKMLMLK